MKQISPFTNVRSLRAGAVAIIMASLFAACATTSGPSSSREAVLNNPDVKGKPPTVFAQPLARVHEAALRALTSVGGKAEQNQTYYISGNRPHKMGLFVGSGGETVEIYMVPQSDKSTSVWVDTDLSFLGIAGQQNWNKQVLGEMTNLLK